jgi:hypothetical protein
MRVVFDLFENALVSRVNRRVCIRTFRFCRSANDVLTRFGSGLPSIRCLTAPRHSAGLYRFLAFRRRAVDFDQHRVVDIAAESALDGF